MSGVADGARELSVSSQKVTKILREAGKEMVPDNALTEPESASLLIAVRDSGPGSDATELQQVFAPSIPLSRKGWAWALPSAVRLSKLIKDICGRRPTCPKARFFSSRCQCSPLEFSKR